MLEIFEWLKCENKHWLHVHGMKGIWSGSPSCRQTIIGFGERSSIRGWLTGLRHQCGSSTWDTQTTQLDEGAKARGIFRISRSHMSQTFWSSGLAPVTGGRMEWHGPHDGWSLKDHKGYIFLCNFGELMVGCTMSPLLVVWTASKFQPCFISVHI